jgi:hypothetical protein
MKLEELLENEESEIDKIDKIIDDRGYYDVAMDVGIRYVMNDMKIRYPAALVKKIVKRINDKLDSLPPM